MIAQMYQMYIIRRTRYPKGCLCGFWEAPNHLILPPVENAFSGWLLVTFASASTEVDYTQTLFLGSSLILHGSTAPGPIQLNSRLAPYQWDLDLVR